MVNSVGKTLQQARLNKQLSIEEAARVTRIRPDKLLDLEEDNYSNFPSLSYAKSFLLLYARFLDVDVQDFADSLHATNPVSSDDYEYLNAASEGPQPPPSRRPYHFAPRRERTILPVIVFGVLTAAVAFIIYLVVSFQRLGNLEDIADKKDLSSPTASPAISTIPAAPAVPVASAIPIPAAAPVAVATRAPEPEISSQAPIASAPVGTSIPVAPAVPAPPDTTAAAQPPLPPPAPAGAFDPTREVRRAEPVAPAAPAPPAHTDASPTGLPPVGAGPLITSVAPLAAPAEPMVAPVQPAAAPDALKQVSILPIRKTLVTIRKDVADSAPIFEDWLYPGDGPLKVSGHKLWIQVQDPGAVQITQDGQPVPAGQSDIQIE
jgi:cytoskeletal protein RodZ